MEYEILPEVKELLDSGEKLMEFSGEFFPLHNMFGCTLAYEEILYPSIEHFFWAMKTDQPHRRKNLAAMPYGYQVQRAGQNMEARADKEWNEKLQTIVMRSALKQKFDNPLLRTFLKNTGDTYLVNTTKNDPVWGVLPTGEGKNLLGILLMEIRSNL